MLIIILTFAYVKQLKLTTMKKPNFKKQYRDLEMSVHSTLRELINNSSCTSKHTNTKMLQVNVFDYTELVIVNDNLTFIDSKGYHYSIFTDCTLEDLIDIISKLD